MRSMDELMIYVQKSCIQSQWVSRLRRGSGVPGIITAEGLIQNDRLLLTFLAMACAVHEPGGQGRRDAGDHHGGVAHPAWH